MKIEDHLFAEIDELRRDKERLDWLQKVVSGEIEPPPNDDTGIPLREAIDRAMKETSIPKE